MPQGEQGHSGRLARLPLQAQRLLERARARSKFIDIAVRTSKRYSEDDAGSYAAALTYYVFFALFPLMLFGAAAIGYLTFGNEELTAEFIEDGVKAIPLIKGALTDEGLTFLQENRDAIVGTGLVLALYAGTGMIVALEHSLNKIHRVDEEGNWFEKRVRAVRWLAILGAGGLASIALTTVAEAAGGPLGTVLAYTGGFSINLFLFSTAYKVLPATKLSWQDVFVGAVVAAVAFELLKSLGAAYLTQSESTRSDTYGTLATAATLLVASYLICQATLIAAEVNATLIERRTTRTKASDRTEGSQ